MIFGSFSFSRERNAPSYVEQIRRLTDSEGLIFHQVNHGDFIGGYYLHPDLPYKPDDFYYRDATGDILVLLSGSVYNKAELFHLCNVSAPLPDPELICRLFLQEGPGFVKMLNGDFAIFLLRQSTREVYLYRDHVGIRPVAWTTDGISLHFSTDITGLCKACAEGKGVDSEYLLGYFKYIDFRKAPAPQVKKLLPGHFLHFSERGTEMIKYWHPEKIKTEKSLTYDMMMADLNRILRDAVHIRCDSRFTAGAHVSSGIDSGIVSALARKEYSHQERFYGFSWTPRDYTPEEVKYDERELVLNSCEMSAINPVFSDMSQDDFNRIISSFDDNYGLYFEYKTIEQAAGSGTNLIFSGWGGDEFISEGGRGIEQDLISGFYLRTFFRRNPAKPLRRFIRNQILYVLYPLLGILDSGTAKAFRDDVRYILKPYRKSDRKAIRDLFFHSSRRQHHLRMLDLYHLQNRCESWMTSGFRKGVEYRYPLLDRRIIEYMLKVPSVLLCRTYKFRPVLRELGGSLLPETVRLNLSKNDPVSSASTRKFYKETAKIIMDDLDEMKANPYLSFMDFRLLEQDIRKYKGYSGACDAMVLFKAMISMKAIHEFTKRYSEVCNGVQKLKDKSNQI